MDSQRIAKAKKTLVAAAQDIDDLQENIDSVSAKIKALEDLGVAEGKAHWRDDKYLYIIEPMRNGTRKRRYIGSKPAKVQEALDSIERWAKRRVLIQDRDAIESKLSRMVQRIENLPWDYGQRAWPASLVTT